MRAPGFWNRPPDDPGLWPRLLTPIGALYANATARRLRTGARAKMPVPIICVGNLNAGGVGKTPTVIWVVDQLRGLFLTPHVVSRGYGGSQVDPLLVNPNRHSAARVGDEPLLLSAFADVWVSKDRRAGIEAAIKAGAQAIVLDDGFQHAAIAYDASIVVVDAEVGFGNARCIPAGPLREPVDVGLSRADAILSIGPDQAQSQFRATYALPTALPHATGTLNPLQTGMDWAGMRALAFAGIGRPDKFFHTLKDLGATLVRAEALGDHERLSPALLTRLETEARAKRAQLVTTEKDAARLPPSFRGKVITLPVRLSLPDDNPLTPLLKQAIEG